MLTQIEIDGFKTFKDFKVELAPFQVIVGPNGSGKSNLFDALHLLSRLADTDLLSAFQEMRGDPHELFTKFPEGRTSDRIRVAVEMLLDRKVQDDLGRKNELKYTRLRYEIEIILRTDEYGLERPYVNHESLKAIPRDTDSWCKKYKLSFQNGWLPESTGNEATFINTGYSYKSAEEVANSAQSKAPLLNLYPDGRLKDYAQFNTQDLQRTLLSAEIGTEYLHVFAAREELRSLGFLHLNPESLRKPSSINAPRFLSPDGSNLPTTLARIQTEDPMAFHFISIDMANLVLGILEIRVEKNVASNEYDIWAETADQRSFSAQVLSDGTLRLLALATMRNDPRFHGVLCLEEPENGVDPLQIERMARLLREMATDFNDPEQQDEPLRQMLITTHSAVFISQPDVIDSLLVAITPTRIRGKDLPSMQITRMVPVIIPDTPSALDTDVDTAMEAYSIIHVRKYLEMDSFDEARDQLEKARTLLKKR